MTKMEAKFGSVKKVSLSRAVADEILKMIRSGSLNVGDRLPPERNLCSQFGVSRTSLREGISSLVHTGILEPVAGSGIFIRSASPSAVLKNRLKSFNVDHKTINDMVVFREGLESFIVEMACEHATSDDIAGLERRVDRMEKAEKNAESVLKEDVEFHRELAAASHNKLAVIVFETVTPYIEQWVRTREEILGLYSASGVHRRIVDAVKQGDRNLARETMAGHFRHVRGLVQAVEDRERMNS